MPSNLRSTTRECVHLVTRDGHFRSHDKDSGHTTPSAIATTPCCTQTVYGSVFTERELLPIEVLAYN